MIIFIYICVINIIYRIFAEVCDLMLDDATHMITGTAWLLSVAVPVSSLHIYMCT